MIGVIHLELWSDGYRHVPTIGVLFLASVAGAAVLVVALSVTRRGAVALAAGVYALTSLAALALSRTTGLLGFTERGLDERALATVGAELAAVVAVVLWFAVTEPRPGTSALGARR